ncbi:MAG: hypothetical protein IT436_02090 [Phycisphaerales bacterium]|nr:hypothetical protein [Phycisphaerales bacterium]
MGLFGFGSPPPSERLRLARLERKLDLILEHLGLELPGSDELQEVRDLAARGPAHTIAAIKRYREITGASLYDAKAAIDEMARGAHR